MKVYIYKHHRLCTPQNLIDRKASNSIPPRHCIAARVTAEHAENDFRPTSGRVRELKIVSSMNLWGYSCLGTRGFVHPYADSQIMHLLAWGENREEARIELIAGLTALKVEGEIRTNTRALLVILRHPDFMYVLMYGKHQTAVSLLYCRRTFNCLFV